MGEVADRVGDYVTAYSGDLKSDETLDGQRLVVGGIVVGSRTVVTRARSTMAVVTLEDLQGAVEVVVFPKLYDQTAATWAEGSILLVAGRVDHRGEDVSLLADLVVPWDDAVQRGPESFARDVAAGDRGAYRRRQAGPGAAGPGQRTPAATGTGTAMGTASRRPSAEPAGAAATRGCRGRRASARRRAGGPGPAHAPGRRSLRVAASGGRRGRRRAAGDRAGRADPDASPDIDRRAARRAGRGTTSRHSRTRLARSRPPRQRRIPCPSRDQAARGCSTSGSAARRRISSSGP